MTKSTDDGGPDENAVGEHENIVFVPSTREDRPDVVHNRPGRDIVRRSVSNSPAIPTGASPPVPRWVKPLVGGMAALVVVLVVVLLIVLTQFVGRPPTATGADAIPTTSVSSTRPSSVVAAPTSTAMAMPTTGTSSGQASPTSPPPSDLTASVYFQGLLEIQGAGLNLDLNPRPEETPAMSMSTLVTSKRNTVYFSLPPVLRHGVTAAACLRSMTILFPRSISWEPSV